jgi:cysteine synthase
VFLRRRPGLLKGPLVGHIAHLVDYIDEMRNVPDERAFQQARTAAQEHGMPIGPSAGAALSVGLDISRAQPDARVVTIICDGGEQYFDTLFDV